MQRVLGSSPYEDKLFPIENKHKYMALFYLSIFVTQGKCLFVFLGYI